PTAGVGAAHGVDPFSTSQHAGPLRLHSFPTRRSSDLRENSGGLYRKERRRLENEYLFNAGQRRTRWRCLCDCRGILSILGEFPRSEEHTSELQSRFDLVCRLLLENEKYVLHVLVAAPV